MKNLFKNHFILTLIMISSILLSVTGLNAQEELKNEDLKIEEQKFSNVVGIRYSNISGYGPYYERYFFEHYSIKITGLLYYYEYVEGEEPNVIQDDRNIFYNGGIQFKRDLLKLKNFNAYALIGASYMNDHDRETDNSSYGTSHDTKTDKLVGGLGIGVAATFKNRFVIELEAGYKLINKIHTVGDDPVEFNSSNDVNKSQFGFSLGAGFLF